MQHALLKLMHEAEDSWWYRGRERVVRTVLKAAKTPVEDSALDLGAGYGGMYTLLSRYAKSVDAYEPDTEAKAELKRRGYERVYPDTDAALAARHDLIGLFDVLEHIEDDRGVLKRIYTALTPGGTLVLTVPAYAWLWSVHDEENHHFRRYTRGELRTKFTEAGFAVCFLGHWDMFLLPAVACMRLFGISGQAGLSPGRFVNAVLTLIITIEAWLMRFFPLSCGVSIVAVLRKP